MCFKIMTTTEQNKTSILIIVFWLFLLKYGTTAVLICLLIQILRVLITILDTSNDPRALAVACFDLSQFIQHHPAGRVIVTDLKTKERVMKLMNHENAEVTKNALLCIQRLFLGAKYASFLQVWFSPREASNYTVWLYITCFRTASMSRYWTLRLLFLLDVGKLRRINLFYRRRLWDSEENNCIMFCFGCIYISRVC